MFKPRTGIYALYISISQWTPRHRKTMRNKSKKVYEIMRRRDIAHLKRLLLSSNSRFKGRNSKGKQKVKDNPREIKSVSQPRSSLPRLSLDHMIKGSMFRFLNEKLYSTASEDAMRYFSSDERAFEIYHTGFQQQLSRWPEDPLRWIINYLNGLPWNPPKRMRVADMGCGDARLVDALSSNFKVYSFDLVAVNDKVTACDMAHTPLKSEHVHFVVFCLSLMGTNCRDFIYEANRILKNGGEMVIVDVASRFDGEFHTFLRKLKSFSFEAQFSETTKDTYFVRARLRKEKTCTDKPMNSLPTLKLSPCVYKKR
ncbi:unnamed protein product [Dicrocoelium dendriticum]|nr:unnamed protein product [Dicrocoelium dendriticum]